MFINVKPNMKNKPNKLKAILQFLLIVGLTLIVNTLIGDIFPAKGIYHLLALPLSLILIIAIFSLDESIRFYTEAVDALKKRFHIHEGAELALLALATSAAELIIAATEGFGALISPEHILENGAGLLAIFPAEMSGIANGLVLPAGFYLMIIYLYFRGKKKLSSFANYTIPTPLLFAMWGVVAIFFYLIKMAEDSLVHVHEAGILLLLVIATIIGYIEIYKIVTGHLPSAEDEEDDTAKFPLINNIASKIVEKWRYVKKSDERLGWIIFQAISSQLLFTLVLVLLVLVISGLWLTPIQASEGLAVGSSMPEFFAMFLIKNPFSGMGMMYVSNCIDIFGELLAYAMFWIREPFTPIPLYPKTELIRAQSCFVVLISTSIMTILWLFQRIFHKLKLKGRGLVNLILIITLFISNVVLSVLYLQVINNIAYADQGLEFSSYWYDMGIHILELMKFWA